MKLLFLIVLSAGVVAAQSIPPRKDIPAIAKAANGAIVTVVMAVNDKPIAQGSGFLVSPDGIIVTNYHVIATGNIAIVKFPDGSIFQVDGVLAGDKVRDLAIIKIHGKTFESLTLGNSDHVQVGEEVVAIGNPLSLESTVSNGIVSGMRTSKEQGGKFLQTTAPISPGSSGGPLFNMAGEVIGINTLYLEGGENLNFAIPVNDAKLLLLGRSATLQKFPNEAESKEIAPPGPTSSDHKRDIDINVFYRGPSPDLTSEIEMALERDGIHTTFGTVDDGRPMLTIDVYNNEPNNRDWFWNVADLRRSSIVKVDGGFESSLQDCIKAVRKVLDKYRSK